MPLPMTSLTDKPTSCHRPTERSMGGWPVPVLSRAADPAAEVDIDGWFKSDSEWGRDRMPLT